MVRKHRKFQIKCFVSLTQAQFWRKWTLKQKKSMYQMYQNYYSLSCTSHKLFDVEFTQLHWRKIKHRKRKGKKLMPYDKFCHSLKFPASNSHGPSCIPLRHDKLVRFWPQSFRSRTDLVESCCPFNDKSCCLFGAWEPIRCGVEHGMSSSSHVGLFLTLHGFSEQNRG